MFCLKANSTFWNDSFPDHAIDSVLHLTLNSNKSELQLSVRRFRVVSDESSGIVISDLDFPYAVPCTRMYRMY